MKRFYRGFVIEKIEVPYETFTAVYYRCNDRMFDRLDDAKRYVDDLVETEAN